MMHSGYFFLHWMRVKMLKVIMVWFLALDSRLWRMWCRVLFYFFSIHHPFFSAIGILTKWFDHKPTSCRFCPQVACFWRGTLMFHSRVWVSECRTSITSLKGFVICRKAADEVEWLKVSLTPCCTHKLGMCLLF